MGPDPTRPKHTFDPQKKEIFFIRREKIEKFGILRENLPDPTPNQRWLTRPNRTRATKIDPTQVKKF